MKSSSWTDAADIEPRRKSGALFLLVFLHRLAGEPERLDSRGHAAVHRHLKQDLADLLARAAVGERALHVGLELVRAVQSGEHAEVDEAAELARQLRPRPQPSPAGLGHQLLHRHAEIIDSLELAFDVFRAEHFLAHGESLVPQFFRHGAILSVDLRETVRRAYGSTRRSPRSTASRRRRV